MSQVQIDSYTVEAASYGKPKITYPKTPKPATSKITKTSNYKSPKPAASANKVGVWELQSSEFTEFAPPDRTESLFNGTFSESVIGGDGRKMVPKKELAPGGKYRAIVKLFLRFAGQPDGGPWAMATGWLIENDLLVTAGHCAHDWSNNYGRLTHVKAYIGYTGKEAVKDSNQVQLRMGIRVASPESWLTRGATESRGDVSFIRVNKPFTGVIPFKYATTPLTGVNQRLGVVGYPGDLMKRSTGEKGALMYEMFLPTNYTLDGSKNKMLQYTIDTFGGNSGSPVLRQGDLISIGVHVLGGNPNSASVISGKYGNSFDALRTALKSSTKGFQWVTIPAASGATNGTATGARYPIKVPVKGNTREFEEEETTLISGTKTRITPSNYRIYRPNRPRHQPADTFTAALDKARRVTTDPLGAIAAYGLHVAGMQARQFRAEFDLAETGDVDDNHEQVSDDQIEADSQTGVPHEADNNEEDDSETANEADVDTEDAPAYIPPDEDHEFTEESGAAAYEGVAERAILTEAAFLTLQEIGPKKCQQLKYMDRIRAYVDKHGKAVGRAGAVVFPSLMAPALQATMTKIRLQQQVAKGNETGDAGDPSVAVEDAAVGGFGPKLDKNHEAIIEELTNAFDTDNETAHNGSIADIIDKGLRIPGAIIAKVAESDLPDLTQRAEALQEASTESLEAALEDSNSPEYLYDAMAQRALIGEAMLEAILNTPAPVQSEEGLFSIFKKFIKVTAKVVGTQQSQQQQQQQGKGETQEFFGWVKAGLAVFKAGSAIYNAVKKKGKREFVDGEEGDETVGGEEGGEGDGWDEYILQGEGY
ncbi:hypothetical protein B0J11DRAFT_611978 [Dendryphion nanum]|uniref:Serine protease n=1 Tax=Dendryphion nanum TaxID=256645 RepID=A0A9P9IZ11_9PLEO|nr:hypothetical protein B0J11DRAFT_611978 [Dendryphion nanum]